MAKRTKLSLSFKVDVIKKFEENPSATKKSLADHFKIPESTLKGILKKRDEILTAERECGNQSSKRSRIQGGKFQKLESVLLEWFKETRASNIPVNIELLRQKAVHLSETLEIENFSASHGWVEKFKIRHGLGTRTLSGESASVAEKTVERWKEDLPCLVKGYEAKNIFNCDETGLFFKMMPNKTLAFKGEPCHGGRNSKERITVLLCCNADGSEKLTPIVIGKSKKPRCFRNIKRFPCEYFNNNTAWMTSKIFLNFLNKFEKDMEKQKRNVLLFMDQCPAHPRDLPKLEHVKVLFFPANCTSKLQPLDLSLIRCLKVHYRKTLIRRYLAELETGKSAAADVKISILDAMNMVCAAWRSIGEKTIKNCFNKAGFKFHGEYECSDQTNEKEDWDIELGDEEWKSASDGLVCFNEFVDVDHSLVTTEQRDIEEIANEMMSDDDDDDDDNEENDAKIPPNHTKALEALDTIRDYLQFNATTETPFSHLYELEKIVSVIHLQKHKQSSIMDYFERK